MRSLKSLSDPPICELRSPCQPNPGAGMAILISLSILFLQSCSQPPDSLPETPPIPTPTAVHSPSPTVAPTPIPTEIPSPVTPTPIPTVPPKASTIILQLTIAPADTQIPYDRDEWRHWIDSDDDCQNTRHEVLLSESTMPAEFEDSRKCQVVVGSWTDPYTREVITSPRDLDIDHMVPLINAHKSGGYAWDQKRKREYANDLAYAGHLIAVSASANRSKGGKGPDEWRPPNMDYWCQYALDWIAIKREWDLTATGLEADALNEMLSTCETRVFIQTTRKEDRSIEETLTSTVTSLPQTTPPTETPTTVAPARTAPPTQTPTPVPVLTPTPTPMSVDFPKPLPDHNCSDFYIWSQAQAFFESQGGPGSDPHQLDHDGDGIACQTLPGAPGGSLTPESGDVETASLTSKCSDFNIWEEAQAFFVSHGGPKSDPYGLDMDGNGIPCQSLIGAPTPTPTITPTPTPIQDRNCSDFNTWQEAQSFFESEGGPESDPHRLDRDGDGVACQSLPGSPNSASSSRTTDSRNCSDFNSWSEAQSFYESEGGPASDPHRLDRDGDGIACQSLPGAPSSEPNSNSSAGPEPTPTVMTSDTHNCSDFDTWSEAQTFFEAEGGPGSDPHRLDRDGNGIACQSLPGAPNDQSEPESSAGPAPTPIPKPKDTHNCSDFDTWQQAQSFFESEGGPASDPHRLDRDGDGIACQSLPGAPSKGSTSKPVPIPTPRPKDTHNCSDFDTWQEAQDFFEAEGGPGSDPHNLDGNDDGIACESLLGAPDIPSPTPASAVPTPTTVPASETFEDRNCSDFSTWSEAQAFFESEGGPASDPHRLDGDGDGIACQSLPGAPGKTAPTPVSAVPTSTPTSASETFEDRNCSDFDNWPEAQAFFESEGGPASDPHRLDGDGDGIACQSLPGAPGKSAASSTSESEDTHNCSDFDTWAEAQSFFESEGGPDSDPHGLDRDGDGIACQSLPGAP